MIATPVGFVLCTNRVLRKARTIWRGCRRRAAAAFLLTVSIAAISQETVQTPAIAPAPAPSSAAIPIPANPRNAIAIVPIDAANREQAQVTGALQVANGTAFILSSGTVTSGSVTTN